MDGRRHRIPTQKLAIGRNRREAAALAAIPTSTSGLELVTGRSKKFREACICGRRSHNQRYSLLHGRLRNNFLVPVRAAAIFSSWNIKDFMLIVGNV
jgi:hypothetical protein